MMKLQRIRKARGMSQGNLAEASGVSVRMIQHYEQGTNDINGAAGAKLYKLAKALDCNIEDLLEISKID